MVNEIELRMRVLNIMKELDETIDSITYNKRAFNRFAKIADSLTDAREIVGQVLKYKPQESGDIA